MPMTSTLTPMQLAVLRHPAWQNRRYVTKDDVVSRRPGDGLPSTPQGAQRILTALNGGPLGTGTQYIGWCPGRIPGVRFAYELKDPGLLARADT